MSLLTPSEAGRIAAAVVGDSLGALPASLLVRSGLAPRAYLTGRHVEGNAELITAFASAAWRHRRVRAELVPLLTSWQDAGIRVMIFKGFHLAEWVCREPALRPYGDVDVLIDPAEAASVRAVAVAAGWRLLWSRRDSGTPHKHEEMQLISPSGETHLDVHRFVIHCASPIDRVQRRVTAAAWLGAREALLDDARVMVLRPEDAVLIGLVLNRFWSPDDLTIKPLDYDDVRTITNECGVGLDDLARRARELGCTWTWRLFRSRCDPWAGRLSLQRPPLAARQWYFAQIARERLHPHVEDVVVRVASMVRESRPCRRSSR